MTNNRILGAVRNVNPNQAINMEHEQEQTQIPSLRPRSDTKQHNEARYEIPCNSLSELFFKENKFISEIHYGTVVNISMGNSSLWLLL